MNLYEQIRAAGTPRTTKAEIVEYFQNTYHGRGANSWKQKLVNTLSAMTGMKPKNLEKRFDPQRLHNAEPRNAAQYRQLGEMLPPIPPEGGYHIYGTVFIKFSDGECEPREVDEYITGEDAATLSKAAADDLVRMVVNHYMETDLDEQEENYSVGSCQPPQLDVEPIE